MGEDGAYYGRNVFVGGIDPTPFTYGVLIWRLSNTRAERVMRGHVDMLADRDNPRQEEEVSSMASSITRSTSTYRLVQDNGMGMG